MRIVVENQKNSVNATIHSEHGTYLGSITVLQVSEVRYVVYGGNELWNIGKDTILTSVEQCINYIKSVTFTADAHEFQHFFDEITLRLETITAAF